MKDMTELADYRDYTLPRGVNGGHFHMGILNIVASWGGGWDHVSVSTADRVPTWEEMEQVKRAFFRADEVVMQLHPALNQYKNVHPNCLHLWRPQNETIPLPPREFV
jgi:hypothetical protein